MCVTRGIRRCPPQKFKSRRQSLPQPVAGFELAKHSGQLDLNRVSQVLCRYAAPAALLGRRRSGLWHDHFG